jgi:hypothetical protein
LSMSSCGGDASGAPGGGDAAAAYTIGGTVSGLSGSGLALQNNGGNNLSVPGNGAFTFGTALDAGAAYSITVLTQPTAPAQRCSVTNGTGMVAQANVTNVAITCVTVMFTPVTGTMTSTRIGHTATLLPSGQVLLTGGFLDISRVALDSAELYDAATQSFTAISARMTSLRNQHTATLLPGGQVLIAGGSNVGNGDGLDTAELYDPATQTFTALTARMMSPRGGHKATLLADGQVLLTGGFFDSSVHLNTAELYNPATQLFGPLAATLTTPRASHTATLLPDGAVLLTGGGTGSNGTLVALHSAELYGP